MGPSEDQPLAWGSMRPSMDSAANRAAYPTRISRLGEPEDDSYLRSLAPGERMEMVWALTLQAWAFKEGLQDEPRLRRDVVRVVRRGG